MTPTEPTPAPAGAPFALPVGTHEIIGVDGERFYALRDAAMRQVFRIAIVGHVREHIDYIAAAINAYTPRTSPASHPAAPAETVGEDGKVLPEWLEELIEVAFDYAAQLEHLDTEDGQLAAVHGAREWSEARKKAAAALRSRSPEGERATPERRCIIPAKFDDRRQFNVGRSARDDNYKGDNERTNRERRRPGATPDSPVPAPSGEPKEKDVT